MEKFSDNSGQSGVMISLGQNDEVKYFKMMWQTMNESFKSLIDFKEKDVWKNPLLHIIMKNGEINNYIKEKYWMQYEQALINWIQKYVSKHEDGYKELFNSISSKEDENMNKDEILEKILKQLFELIGGDKKKFKALMKFEGNSYQSSFLEGLLDSENKYVKSFGLILNMNMFNDREKRELLGIDLYRSESSWRGHWRNAARNDNQDNVLQMYEEMKNDKSAFKRLLMHETYGLKESLEKMDRNVGKILDMVIECPLFNKKVCFLLFSCFL